MKRHGFDAFSLIFGLAFAAVGATFLWGDPDVSKMTAEAVWPFVAIFIGLLVLAAATKRGAKGKGTDASPPEDRPTATDEG